MVGEARDIRVHAPAAEFLRIDRDRSLRARQASELDTATIAPLRITLKSARQQYQVDEP